MISGISQILGNSRKYILFDSFQGLPKAKEIDGKAANDWQADVAGPFYHDNCAAEKVWVEKALKLSHTTDYELVEGWFEDTVPKYVLDQKISILHLDGDWYDSTKICLDHLFSKVTKGGLILIDDYQMWDGCSKALHDYLSENKLSEKIRQYKGTVTYLMKE